MRFNSTRLRAQLLVLVCVAIGSALSAQSGNPRPDYVIGPQDVLTITSYDQSDLSGRYTVDSDGSFTYALIGRVTAGGLTLRDLEAQLKKRLRDEGYFNNPQITVSIDQYKSQKVFIMGEVRTPGPVTLTGGMSLVEALARAGSTLPTASGEAVIVRASAKDGPTLPSQADTENVVRINLRDLENGVLSQNAALTDGDTIFVPRAESVYVFGQVKNPGAYPLQSRNTTVLQALALAGGITDRGSMSRIRISRIVDGKQKEIPAKATDLVLAGDTVIVKERFF
jgi:polysaccharide export outer membrane protein